MAAPPPDIPPPTRVDVARTRRDGALDQPMSGGALPASLAGELEVVAAIPTPGAEADLLIVRDGGGGEFVLKTYRPGFRADREVWRQLPAIGTSHIVRILRTGEDDGRDFELQEYARGGNLAGLLADGAPWPYDRITETVGQLTEALAALHAHGIVHRDLKPANVLVRTAWPLDLALADFGLSRGINASVVFGTASRTLAYAPPESFAGETSRSWDWWSLGILVLEMATGRSPFRGLTEHAVMHHLLTSTMDVGPVADPRLRLLCRGLLLRDPAQRWGVPQVTQWLNGGTPPVPEDVAPRGHASGRVPLPFLGERYVDRASLARAMATRWDEAARRYLANMGTTEHPSEGWRALREWLQQFDQDEEERQVLIDERLTVALPPDLKLLHLLHWLDPAMPPVYRGLALNRESLLELALSALARPADAQTTIDDLWNHRILEVLADLSGEDDLRWIDARWRELETGFVPAADRVVAETQGLLPGPAFDGVQVRSALLALAVDPETTRTALRSSADRVRQELPEPVPWHAALATSAHDPDLVAAALASGLAHAWAQAELRRRESEAAAHVARQRQWEDMERAREAAKSQALGWAALAFGCFSVPWFVSMLALTGGDRSFQAGVMLLIWAGIGVGEVAMAAQIGGEYHPRYSLLRPMGRIFGRASGPAEFMRGLGNLAGSGCGGCLVAVIGFWVVLAIVVTAGAFLVQALILPLAVAVAYGVWTHRRWTNWTKEFDEAKRRILGAGA
ncbi:protein kinase [Streptosporangiaceae bacterium NEAU-GS5]|nr:protein kinase [Streptosporangiaceae bacterium NEAU-GS5]